MKLKYNNILIAMKQKTIYRTILFLSSIAFLTSCTDLLTNTNNPSSSSSSSSKLGISITSPKTNDTVTYRGRAITYSVKKDAGIHAVALYVNGTFVTWNQVNADGSQPAVYLTFDTSYIGKRISYFLIYYDNDSTSIQSDSVKNILVTDVSKAPAIPYNFIATTISGKVINLSWKDSTIGVMPGYEIWRKRGYYGQFNIYLSATPGNYNINDMDAADSTVYYYKIRALNSYGTSDFSAVINTYGDGASRSIAPPTALKAAASAANVVTLTWTDDIGTVNYYKIERRYPWTNYVSVGFAVKGATQYVDSANGLTGSATYNYRVKAIAGNDSSWSNEAIVTTPWQ
jgi:hypothetical protein